VRAANLQHRFLSQLKAQNQENCPESLSGLTAWLETAPPSISGADAGPRGLTEKENGLDSIQAVAW